MRLARPAAVAAVAFLAAAVAGTGAVAVAGRADRPPGAPAARGNVVTIRPGVIHALAGALATPPTTAFCERQFRIACYLPAQLQRAYNLPRLYRQGITGRGQTIIIVDSFGSPTIQRDLRRFDRAAGLPAPPSLKVIQPAGPVPPYQPNSDREG